MAEGIAFTTDRDPDGGCRVLLRVTDPKWAGKRAKVRVQHSAQVKRSNPVHKAQVLVEREVDLAHGDNEVLLGDALGDAFVYAGEDIDLALVAEATVDDGIIFDTKVEANLAELCTLPPRLAAPAESASVHSPKDRFDFFANLRAIPAKARAIVMGLMLVGGPVIVINALVGVRDQLVPESSTWMYDHSGSDGSESPIMKALAGSGTVGLALWLAIRRQLQKYMKFNARWPLQGLEPGARCRAGDIVSGESGVLLEQATVRIVAYNQEHGQHRVTEGSGKNRRTVTREFTKDSRGVVLYERLLPRVGVGERLDAHLDDEIDFGPVFTCLYPPCRIGATHGLSLQIEAQLIHPVYVDHDVQLDPGQVDPRHFRVVAAPRPVEATPEAASMPGSGWIGGA